MLRDDFHIQAQSHFEDNGSITAKKNINDDVCLFLVEHESDEVLDTETLVMAASGEQNTIKKHHLSKLLEYQNNAGASTSSIIAEGDITSSAKRFAEGNDIDVVDPDSLSSTFSVRNPLDTNILSRRTLLGGIGVMLAGSGYMNRDLLNFREPPFVYSNEAKAEFADDANVSVPEFRIVEDTGPRILLLTGRIGDGDVEIGDTVIAEIAVANGGGTRLDTQYDLRLTFSQDDDLDHDGQGVTAAVGPLESGEVEIITVGPFTVHGGGTWQIRTQYENAVESNESDIEANYIGVETHPGYDLQLTVPPERVGPTDWIEPVDGIRIQAEVTEYQQGLIYQTVRSHQLEDYNVGTVAVSPPDSVFARIRTTVENMTAETVRFDDGNIDLGGSQQTELEYQFSAGDMTGMVTDREINQQVLPSESSFNTISVGPNRTEEAWLLAPVPIEENTTAQLGFSTAADNSPEFAIEFETSTDVPTFELMSLDVPDDWVEEEQELAMIVENTSNVSGTFRGAIQRLYGQSTWVTLNEPFVQEIRAGEQERLSVTVTGETDAVLGFRALPFYREFEI